MIARTDAPVVCFSGVDSDLAPGATCGPITRDIYIIECNTSGFGSVIINGREFPVRPRDCYILLPGDTITHTASLHNPRRGVWIAADGLSVGRALNQAGITSENPYAPPELFDALTAEIKAICDMHDDTDSGAEFRKSGHLYEFLGLLLKSAPAQGSADWLTRVIGHIETYYYEPLSVSELAKTAHLERSYFSVRFKKEMGISPHAYLTATRIRKSCELLRKTNCPIAEAAELVGIDPINFSRIFKRETGLSPKQYIAGTNE